MKKGLLLAAAAVLIFASTACKEKSEPAVQAPAAQTKPVSLEQNSEKQAYMAPDFELKDIVSGETFSLSGARGKVILLDFWATWCGPCRMGIPHFREIQKKYKDKGVQIVAVSVDQKGTAYVADFAKKSDMAYTVLHDSTGQIGGMYGGIRSIPTAFLIGRDGAFIQRYVGSGRVNFLKKKFKKH